MAQGNTHCSSRPCGKRFINFTNTDPCVTLAFSKKMIRAIFDLYKFSRSKPLLAAALMSVLFGPSPAVADMSDWKHSGLMYIVTTPAGANLPASALEKGLLKLKRLVIVGPHIRDLSPVGNLPNLTYLALAYSRVDDFQPLLNLKHLKGLQLEGNDTAKANLKIVAKLPELTFLKLQACRIDDLSALRPLTKLEHIHLDSNQITDLTPLEEMAALRILDLYNNKVTDARPLVRLTGMEIVRLGRNPITNFAP